MEIPMTVICCADCGLPFAITQDYEERRREDHKQFYCPAGHPQSYKGKSELELAREARDTAIRLKLAAQKELEDLRRKKCKKAKKQ